MKNYFHILILLIPSLYTCKQSEINATTYSTRDSIIKDYLNIATISDQFDTTETGYKALKAYIANDTVLLRQMHINLISAQKFDDQWAVYDSCVQQNKLQNLNIDTGYRFLYNMAFCPYQINATITKRGDTATLNFILYQPKWDTAECRIISQFDKPLTKKNWNDLMDAIEKSDFWGLKKDNGVHGVDGDGLTMIGYIKSDPRFPRAANYAYVYRWGLYSTSLHDLFTLLLRISGNKKGCIWVQ